MRKRQATRRSDCPLNASLETVGDRWSLLIVRDMMLRGASTFAEFLDGYEHIATNILTDRLRRLRQTELRGHERHVHHLAVPRRPSRRQNLPGRQSDHVR